MHNPLFGALIAEGKTKQIYAHATDGQLVYIVNKDDITAGDGTRRNAFEGKSKHSTRTTANIFVLLNEVEISTHFIEMVDEVTLLVQRCSMIPVEQVQRRIAFGSYLKRHPEVTEGTCFDPVLVETFLKGDIRHDPQIWKEDIITQGFATGEEIDWMSDEGRHLFEVLEQAWADLDMTLVDLKIEFGRNTQGKLMVADVIDNDSWRLWPSGDKRRMLDKQIYRDLHQITERDLEQIAKNYATVANLASNLKFHRQAPVIRIT